MSKWVRTCLVPPVKDSTLRRWWSQPRAETRSHFPVTVGLVKMIKSLWNTSSRLRKRCLLVSVLKSGYERGDKYVYLTRWQFCSTTFTGNRRNLVSKVPSDWFPRARLRDASPCDWTPLRKISLAILAAVSSFVLYGFNACRNVFISRCTQNSF